MQQLDNFEIVGAITIVVIMLLILLIAFASRKKVNKFPYILNEALFTPAEAAFHKVLDQAVGSHCHIFGKVRVADIVHVQSMKDRGNWQRAFNRISSKHFDFILCAPNDGSILCALELDDKTHSMQRRIERDEFLEGVCEAVNLPLIRIRVQRSYNPDKIRDQVINAVRNIQS